MKTILKRESFTSPYKRNDYIADLTAIVEKLRGNELDSFCSLLEKQGYSVMEGQIMGTDNTYLYVI